MDTGSSGYSRRAGGGRGGGRGEHRHRATLEAEAIGTIHPGILVGSWLLQCLSHDVTQPSARGSPQTSSQAEGTLLARWEGQGVPRWGQELQPCSCPGMGICWKCTRLSSWVCPHNHRDQGSALIGSALPGTTSPRSQHQPDPPCPPQGLCQTAPARPAGNCSTWMHSRLQITQDRSNLSIPAWQSWRKPRQEHSCLTYIVNIL